jgi:glycosyltransferase involved in cell wall biosynthesis
LFVKDKLAWPRSSGHDIHCFHLMRALERNGHPVSLTTVHRPLPEAIAGLPLQQYTCLTEEVDAHASNGEAPLALSRFQERFRSYWGIDPARIRAVGRAARACRAEVVVAVGLNVLPYLGDVEGTLRVWYAADEWAWHHLSQVRLTRPSTWGNISQALIKGLYERVYAPLLDCVWVVSEGDRRAMRWVAGIRHPDVIFYGLDADHFAPQELPQQERSCVFWGRLDFGPNIQALEWFCKRVWPTVRQTAPDAHFSIYGFQPTPPVQALVAPEQGITLVPDLPDLRPEIARHQVVVLPFVSGGGVKNKLLEAAGMGKAVLCTPRTCGGLRTEGLPPLLLARTPAEWVSGLLRLWSDTAYRGQMGEEARRWVVRCHTWDAAARLATASLETARAEKRTP